MVLYDRLLEGPFETKQNENTCFISFWQGDRNIIICKHNSSISYTLRKNKIDLLQSTLQPDTPLHLVSEKRSNINTYNETKEGTDTFD